MLELEEAGGGADKGWMDSSDRGQVFQVFIPVNQGEWPTWI